MRIMSALSICALAIATAPLALAQAGGHEQTGPLPDSATATPAAIRPPPVSFERIGTQNAAIRSIFSGPGPDNTTVQIRELIVAPRATVRLDPARATTLVDPRSGDAELRVGGQPPARSAEGVTTVPAGEPLEITGSETPSILRLYSVEVR